MEDSDDYSSDDDPRRYVDSSSSASSEVPPPLRPQRFESWVLEHSEDERCEIRTSTARFLTDLKNLKRYKVDHVMDEATESLLSDIESTLLPELARCRNLLQEEKERLEIKRMKKMIKRNSEITIWCNNHWGRDQSLGIVWNCADIEGVFRFGKALQNNTTVNTLTIGKVDFRADTADSGPLMRFIEQSRGLRIFRLEDIKDTNQNQTMIRLLLNAAATNINIICVEMNNVPIVYEMTRLMLPQSKSLQNLIISGRLVNMAPPADLSDVFSMNSTLESLELGDFDLSQKQNLSSSFVKSIKHSHSLCELSFQDCTFDCSSTEALLEVLSYRQCNVERLELSRCEFLDQEGLLISNVDPIFFKIIKQFSETNLKEIRLAGMSDVSEILRPFQKDSKLDSFHMLNLSETTSITMICEALPLLCGLKRLLVELNAYYDFNRDTSTTFIKAMQANFCLHELLVKRWVSFELKNEIDSLCKRNKTVQEWIQEPRRLLVNFMPRVFEKCLKYQFHADIIFKLMKNNDSPIS